MGKFAQVVVGPAGCGKSTYCDNIRQHCEVFGRSVHVVNLDPAAEHFKYPVAFDVRDLISLDDVVEELQLGPNGGLLYCMEYLEDNLDDWLGEELAAYGEDDYLIFDCPGQIELYSHVSVFQSFVKYLTNNGWFVCCVYCLDSQFLSEPTKLLAGSLQALSAMVLLELPHVNVMTKADLVQDKEALEELLSLDAAELSATLDESMGPRFKHLNQGLAELLDRYNMVSFLPLDVNDEETIAEVLGQIDLAIQYGEDLEPKIPKDVDEFGMEDGNDGEQGNGDSDEGW